MGGVYSIADMNLVLAAVLCHVALAGKVVELTEENFDKAIQESKAPVFVEFYSPGCGPCAQFAPVWDDLASEFDGELVVAKVNIPLNQGLVTRFEVATAPDLYLIDKGFVYHYEGAKETTALADFATEGYKSLRRRPFPVTPTWFEKNVKKPALETFDDMVFILRFGGGGAVLVFGLSFLLGMLGGLIIAPTEERPKED
eukprot:c7353_g1_i1.p1 GENE.c7353_g1_i1~~c7353_g1_i1.p1  ORF type:complete len:199 (+),score=32.91 c7353_g1_i1:1-597(+)